MTGGEEETKRRETAQDEARAVIAAQNDTLSDIDDKALRTVRLNAVLVGLLIAAVEYAPETFHELTLYGAFGALLLSTLAGMLTYDESNLYLGPDGEYLENLSTGDVDDPWEEDLTEVYAGMVSENYDDLRWNALLLSVTLALLAAAIIVVVVSIII